MWNQVRGEFSDDVQANLASEMHAVLLKLQASPPGMQQKIPRQKRRLT